MFHLGCFGAGTADQPATAEGLQIWRPNFRKTLNLDRGYHNEEHKEAHALDRRSFSEKSPQVNKSHWMSSCKKGSLDHNSMCVLTKHCQEKDLAIVSEHAGMSPWYVSELRGSKRNCYAGEPWIATVIGSIVVL